MFFFSIGLFDLSGSLDFDGKVKKMQQKKTFLLFLIFAILYSGLQWVKIKKNLLKIYN